MNGTEMMLKSMGIDVEGIKKVVNPNTVISTLDSIQNAARKLEEIQASLMRIEIKLETLPKDEALKLLSDNAEVVKGFEKYGNESD